MSSHACPSCHPIQVRQAQPFWSAMVCRSASKPVKQPVHAHPHTHPRASVYVCMCVCTRLHGRVSVGLIAHTGIILAQKARTGQEGRADRHTDKHQACVRMCVCVSVCVGLCFHPVRFAITQALSTLSCVTLSAAIYVCMLRVNTVLQGQSQRSHICWTGHSLNRLGWRSFQVGVKGRSFPSHTHTHTHMATYSGPLITLALRFCASQSVSKHPCQHTPIGASARV